jgi:tetratricopeptide (TPR) repeat protein
VVRVGCGVALAALAVTSAVQMRVWRDDLTLWTHTTRVAPRTFVAHNNLASALSRSGNALVRAADRARDEGDLAEVKRLTDQRRFILKMSVSVLDRAIEVNPDYINAHRNAYINYLRLEERARAVYHIEQVLRCAEKAPPDKREHFLEFRELAAGMYVNLESYEKAAQHYEEILRRKPYHPTANQKLAAVRRRMEEARIE